MNKKVLGWIVTSGLMAAGSLSAQPLNDLQARLAELRNDRPIRLNVDVVLEHKGRAPLHANDSRQHGKAVVVFGRHGAEVREQRWTKRSSRFSLWRKAKNVDTETSLVDESEAGDLVDPVAAMELLLRDATLLSDEEVTWQGQPARLLVIRPGLLASEQKGKKDDGDGPARFNLEAKIWLDGDGSPLALERWVEIRLGPVLTTTTHQTLTFQQVDGRLLVDEAEESFSGKALAMLNGEDVKRMKVTVAR